MRSRVVSNGIERERNGENQIAYPLLFSYRHRSPFSCLARIWPVAPGSQPFPYETLVSAPIFKKRNRLVLSPSDGWNLAVYITTRSICGPSLIIDCWKVFFFSKRVHSSNDLGLCCCGRPVGYEERNRKRMNPPLIHRLFPFLFCGINL